LLERSSFEIRKFGRIKFGENKVSRQKALENEVLRKV
jgi:hypothetical protein